MKDKGGIPELVSHGVNGLLVPPGDVEAWRNAIRGVLDNPAQLEAYVAEQAGSRAAEFDQDYLARKVLAFFEEVKASAAPADLEGLRPGRHA